MTLSSFDSRSLLPPPPPPQEVPKMKKGIRNLCNDNCSTSILDQQNNDHPPQPESNPTLEDMILQLELEEEIARKEKLNRNSLASSVGLRGGGRMSCVNSSDILRSARNALNQYPRFSLDGKDAMYRSSFTVEKPGRKSLCCDYGTRERLNVFDTRKSCSLGGERSVMWCKPGVIAKLMGLEAMPVPISRRSGKETLSCTVKKRQNLRRRVERHEMERRLVMDGGSERTTRGGKGGYFSMKPVAAELEAASGGGFWPTRRLI